MKDSTKKTLNIIGNVVIWLFVAFAVFITILVFVAQANSDGVPSIGGKVVINIVTDSMSPTMKEGDLILGEKLEDEQKHKLIVGDVITFYADLDGNGTDEINTHRIVELIQDSDGTTVGYRTQGDNKETNPVPDKDGVNAKDVICVWRDGDTKIGALGGFLSFLQTSLGFFLVIVLPLIAFFIYELIHFILTVNSVRAGNGGTAKISAADEELIKQRAIAEFLAEQKKKEEESKTDAPTDSSDGE